LHIPDTHLRLANQQTSLTNFSNWQKYPFFTLNVVAFFVNIRLYSGG